MARTLSSQTIAGVTIANKLERKATGIRIILDPRSAMRMHFDFSDIETQTITTPGQEPQTSVLSVKYVGELDATAEEMQALAVFPSAYAALKAMADAKSAEQWPDPEPSQV